MSKQDRQRQITERVLCFLWGISSAIAIISAFGVHKYHILALTLFLGIGAIALLMKLEEELELNEK